MVSTILGVAGAAVTGLASYLVARMKVKDTRQQYYEDKITEILKIQSDEIKNLKEEVQRLVKENKELTSQVISLKAQLERVSLHEIDSPNS